MSYVEWTPDMGEISGFGGSYEAGCRLMVKLALAFWDEQDAAHARGEREKFDPHYQGYEGVFGILHESNADAKALDVAMMDDPFIRENGATGAMHQAAVGHIFAFRELGADEYCRVLRTREAAGVQK